ncbi:type II toxin-antitoxin system RelE/ParE family toxin [Polynucleobacter sp.]|uniref:type II toxin-antitoxin system RelE/ParE family toxin n=1 Tax=Polynucleobacter sp. TaxID=2029855 RepID=UPI00261AD513|nr:type II toxin-antitoxin system RelE/ParE family toxin [Polynucleobacter sp.]MCW1965673.1 type II toxin-antitoxin system RelE/ParE family toxin [Polynucleobacter sp.]
MRRFARQYKKLNDKNAKDVDEAVVKISKMPALGQKKRGDLSKLWVFKFKSNNQLFLLGYTLEDELRLIYLESIGSHENFYRDIKR